VIAQVGSARPNSSPATMARAVPPGVKDPDDEAKLLDAMLHGSTITISGVSRRGTHTKDTYSLAGISTMLDKVHDACSK